MLDFGVLGPLRVVVDGTPRRIGPRKHRILLASLLLRANRPVYLDELIDRLWPATPPSGARRTVQTYAMRLRQELGGAGRLVRTQAEAYSIELAVDELDLSRFTRFTELAAGAVHAGDRQAARTHLRTALTLWRGTPLADVASIELSRTAVPHLVELYCRTIEQRVELDLDLDPSPGREGLVGELRVLVTEHPFRERFWTLLMRALCRAGRPAEALAVYHEVDRLLGAELGVVPGEELRRLHAEVMAGSTPTPQPVPVVQDRLRELLTEALNLIGATGREPG